jgi:hypothetical protein
MGGGYMKRDNFYCHRNIFAIDPGYSHDNGTGYAIFDGDRHRLKACGLIRPFAPGLESHASTIEIADKIRRIWEQEVGFSFDPKILCIEHPLACFTKNGVRVNSKSIITLAILCTRIEERFHAESTLRPYPHQWKKRDSKEQTRSLVLETLNTWSLKVLENDLLEIPPSLHHNIFDAIGIGLWAINQKNQQPQLKKNGRK